MQSLSFFKDTHPDVVVPRTLRGFPDVNARSPNDPTYMFSSQDVFKLITQFADINDRSEIQIQHYVVIWAYAIHQGWKDVYMDGGQLFLVSGFEPRTPVVPPTILRQMLIEVDLERYPGQVNLLGYAAQYDPLVSEKRAVARIVKVVYVKDTERHVLPHHETAMNPHVVGLQLGDGTYMECDKENGYLCYRDIPEGPLCFEIEYSIQFD